MSSTISITTPMWEHICKLEARVTALEAHAKPEGAKEKPELWCVRNQRGHLVGTNDGHTPGQVRKYSESRAGEIAAKAMVNATVEPYIPGVTPRLHRTHAPAHAHASARGGAGG